MVLLWRSAPVRRRRPARWQRIYRTSDAAALDARIRYFDQVTALATLRDLRHEDPQVLDLPPHELPALVIGELPPLTSRSPDDDVLQRFRRRHQQNRSGRQATPIPSASHCQKLCQGPDERVAIRLTNSCQNQLRVAT